MTIETLLVAVVAAVAAVAGVMVVLMRTTVHSALFLVLNFFCLAFLYVTLNAEFVAVVNVIVYAGAIMVLFLFVIFLINPTREEERDRLGNQRTLGSASGSACWRWSPRSCCAPAAPASANCRRRPRPTATSPRSANSFTRAFSSPSKSPRSSCSRPSSARSSWPSGRCSC